MSVPVPATRRSRRELAVAVFGCLAGAGLALYAARQPWLSEVTPRQPPLTPLRESHTGGELAPWVPAAALVGLAAAVALYATRRWGRRLVALTAFCCGVALAVGGGYGLTVAAGLWPVACLAGGLLVAGTGGFALLRGQAWPAMGDRYQRPDPTPPADAGTDDPARLWDALDAGADPTQRPDPG